MGSLHIAFFLSGVSALQFEVLWIRRIALAIGSSPVSFAAVTAVVVLSFGVGAILVRNGDASFPRRPLRFAAAAQAAAAAASLAGIRSGSPSFLLLAVSFVLFGSAVSAVAKAHRRSLPGAGRGTLFGVNVTGGGLGVLSAGFLLVPAFGIRAAGAAGVGTAFLSSLLLLLAGGRGEGPVQVEYHPASRGDTGKDSAAAPILLAWTGFTGLGVQILWGRWLSQLAGGSSYTYFSVLAVSVLAFGLGCLRGGGTGKGDTSALRRPGVRYAALAIGFPLLSLASLLAARGAGASPSLLISALRIPVPAAAALAAAALVFPPLFASGAFFAFTVDGGMGRVPDYRLCLLANGIGAAASGAAVPFLLVPALGTGGAFSLLCGMNLLPAWTLLRGGTASREGARGGYPAALGALGLLACGMAAWTAVRPVYFLLPQTLTSPAAMEDADGFPRAGPPRYYREGAGSTVVVLGEYGSEILVVDGKPESHARKDRSTQVMLSQIPFLVRNGPVRDVLLIGLGGGDTLRGILAHPVARVDCAEISGEVVAAAGSAYGERGASAVRDPRVRIAVTDGRRFLRGRRGEYGLIVSQPSNPWVLGASSLFTREAFSEMAAALRPGGSAVVWFQTYGATAGDVSTAEATIRSAFPHVLVFSFTPGDILFLCSLERRVIDVARLDALFSAGGGPGAGILRDAGISRTSDVLGGFFGGAPEADAPDRRGTVALNTDDRPVLEYSLAGSIGSRDPHAAFAAVVEPLARRMPHLRGAPAKGTGAWGEFALAWGESASRAGFARYAGELFEEALREGVQEARALNDLGIVMVESNNYDNGIRYFEKALELDPDNRSARENLETLKKGGRR